MVASGIVLIGAEHEENLSLRYLSAALQAAGFSTKVVPYDAEDQRDAVIEATLSAAPIAVGISVPFQHHAQELLGIATALRARGYQGHICVGGHFATFEYKNILDHVPAVDSVARHEGEQTLTELCRLLRDGHAVTAIGGLVIRDAERVRLSLAGAPGGAGIAVGDKRPLPDLDTLAHPDRRGEPHDVLGVPCSPIVGSRGCYADCSFCCIFAYADNAHGARYRMRSPEDIVREMKEEYDGRGVRLFVFHDDNFFVPHAPKNIKRYSRLAELMRAEGLTDIGLVIKCRPNDVDPELFQLLKSIGMIRTYIGIETNSDEGVVSLNRGITSEDNRRALDILRSLDVYHSFNVLIFDPEATLEGVARNLDFMEAYADTPFNFCRAEVYAGTPLKAKLEAEGRLSGNYLAWGYEMRDPRVELLFRITTTAFFGRNFKPDGIANLNMGIRFDHEVLRHFYPDAWDTGFGARAVAFSRAVGEDTVARARQALDFVQEVPLTDAGAVNAFTLELARGVARADLRLLGMVKALRREMDARVRGAGVPAAQNRFGRGMPVWAAETARLGSSVGLELSTELLPAPRGDAAWMR